MNLRILSWIIAAGVDGLTAALLWRYEADHAVALLESAVCCAITIMGLVVAENAGKMQIDPRPLVRGLAQWALIGSFFAVIPTTIMGGGAMAMRMQDRAATEYRTSDAYAKDKQLSDDVTADGQVRANANARLERAIAPTQVRMGDGSYFGGVFAFLTLSGLPIALMAVGSMPKAETQSERRARVRAENAALKAKVEVEQIKASKQGWFRGLFINRAYKPFVSPDARRRA